MTLKGEYNTILAATLGAGGRYKRLIAVLDVYNGNGYSLTFLVQADGIEKNFPGLTAAIRYYEAQP